MKELRGSATAPVKATPEQCIAMIAAVDRYPTWYPDVIREVEVLERDDQGVAKRARTRVHLAFGPLTNDYRFEVTVAVKPTAVVLVRVPNDASDPEQLEIHWRIHPRRLGVDVVARLDLPRFLPVGNAGDSVAQGFVEAARRVLEDSSAKASASSS
jgi:ribosome-associated toxin RatA of RatAB toxin-antitoxin module